MSREKLITLFVLLILGAALPLPTTAQNKNSPCVVTDEDLTATIAPEDQDKKPLDGRLGGQVASWDARYGESSETSGDLLAYDFEGCGPLTGTQFAWERAVSISLYADRPEDIEQGTLSNPDAADWTQDEALAIAYKLLPKDAELAESETTDAGNILMPGTSEILGTYTGQERYDVVNATGEVGSLQVLLYLDDAEEVFAIDVQLGGYGEGESAAANNEASEIAQGASCGVEAESDSPLDARLGGTRESFEAVYGAPISEEHFIEYEIEGCGTVFVDYYEGVITSIGLFSPRGVDQPYNEPHDADWTIVQAIEIAERFLPLDRNERNTTLDDPEWVLMDGSSAALANDVPAAAYEYVDNTPAYGEYQAVLFKTTAGDISWIEIQLQVEEDIAP